MTTLGLQEELANEIETITKDMVFKNAEGENVKIKAYKQVLPLKELIVIDQEGEEVEDPFPYCIVRIADGKIDGDASVQEVRVLIIIGLYNNNLNGDGYISVLNIVHRIHERFLKCPILGDFLAKTYFKWDLQDADENTFPYHFGMVEMIWDIPCIEREFI